MCLPGYRTLSDLSDEELIEACEMYDIGELLSTEEQIDYLMARLPGFFPVRPKLVSYNFTEEDRVLFERLHAQMIADGLDVDEEF